jgi:succinate dehydrogenase/fumarate reductase cytochrome b subunit
MKKLLICLFIIVLYINSSFYIISQLWSMLCNIFNGIFKQFKNLNNYKNIEHINLLGNLIIYAQVNRKI